MRDLKFIVTNYPTLDLKDNDKFVIESISNFTFGSYELAVTTNPFLPGDSVQSMTAAARDMEFVIKPNKDKGDYNSLIREFSRYIGKKGSLQFVNGSQTWNIEGIMQEFETDRYSADTRINFTLHCENPFWKGIERSVTFIGGSTGSQNIGVNKQSIIVSGDIPAEFILHCSTGSLVVGDKVVLNHISGSDYRTEFIAKKALNARLSLDTRKGHRSFIDGTVGAVHSLFDSFDVKSFINGIEAEYTGNPFVSLANYRNGTISLDIYKESTGLFTPASGDLSLTEAWL